MSQSSPTRVFTIFELLEHILLDVEPYEKDTEHNNCFPKDSPVVARLFALQRVNRTIRTAIQRSRPLLRRMLLEAPLPRASSPAPMATQSRSLPWFLDPSGLSASLIGKRVKAHFLDSPSPVIKVNASKGALNAKNTTASYSSPNSTPSHDHSWRRVPLLLRPTTPPTSTTPPLRLSFLIEYDNDTGMSRLYKVGWYVESSSSLRPTTLGDFHDFCEEILGRQKEVHRMQLGKGGARGVAMCCFGEGDGL